MKKNKKLGSLLTYFDSIDSTNNYANLLLKEKKISDGQVIIADFQSGGRGQRGSIWESEKGKNILFSIYIEPDNLLICDQSLLTKFISISLCEVLSLFRLDAKIKWPNDIVVDGKKICGILIENHIEDDKIKGSIIGIGLNVNQEKFEIEKVTSLKLQTGKDQDRMKILGILLDYLDKNRSYLSNNKKHLNEMYLRNLYNLRVNSNFYSDLYGNFSGFISDVDSSGKIEITTDLGVLSFGIKELKFC